MYSVILLAQTLLVFVGTIFCYSKKNSENIKSESKIITFIRCFSWVENTKSLFKINNDSGNKSESKVELRFIHGIRVLSIYWILVAHVFLFYPFLNLNNRVSPVRSLGNRLEVIRNLFTHFIVNAGLAVETFFLIR